MCGSMSDIIKETTMDEQYALPEPLGAAIHFVERTNEMRMSGVEMDTAQILAAKVACVAIREYFSRVVTAVEAGIFDPVACDPDLFDAYKTDIEEDGGTTEADS